VDGQFVVVIPVAREEGEKRERMEWSMIVRCQGFMGFIILEDMDYFA